MFNLLRRFWGCQKVAPLLASVLLIEDNRTDQIFMTKVLEKHGAKVWVVGDGEGGIALAQAESVDVIILDYLLPDMTGLEVCRQLKNNPKTRRIPVIFLTVVQDGYTLLECFEAGAYIFLTKPLAAKELINQIKWALQEAKEEEA